MHRTCTQVQHLQAQANQHRASKERLQAAVTAALSGEDVNVHQQSDPPAIQAAVNHMQQLPKTSAVIEAEVADLQSAVSSLQVANFAFTSHRKQCACGCPPQQLTTLLVDTL